MQGNFFSFSFPVQLPSYSYVQISDLIKFDPEFHPSSSTNHQYRMLQSIHKSKLLLNVTYSIQPT